jgi:hypothetical protein
MSNHVIISPEQIDLAWLTSVLKVSGALTEGSVAAFDVDTGRGNWSSNALLHLRYTEHVKGEAPPRLFLKMVNADLDDDESFSASEVTYYTRDYLGVAGAPLVRCYDAAYSEALRRYHLLLDDLTPTHVVKHCAAIICCSTT